MYSDASESDRKCYTYYIQHIIRFVSQYEKKKSKEHVRGIANNICF